jgi:hypothetical protein
VKGGISHTQAGPVHPDEPTSSVFSHESATAADDKYLHTDDIQDDK